jgi:ornithine cyclodeaminase/alanine dehydrogenase
VPATTIDGATAERLLTRAIAREAARQAAELAANDGLVKGRTSVKVGDLWMRILAAGIPELDLLGYKEFHILPPDQMRYTCHLFRLSTGEPLGVVDAHRITRLRTAASAALAVQHVFGDRPVRIAVIGSGSEAREGLAAIAEVVSVTEACVFSPRASSRASFAADLGVRDASSVAECTKGADLVYSATHSSGAIVLTPDDLRDARMLATIGSTTPFQRECSGDVFAMTRFVVVDTLDCLQESGDLIEAGGVASVLLGDFLAAPPPSPDAGFVIYKSIGSAEQDLTLAAELLKLAEETT